jgi:hypothetical protein
MTRALLTTGTASKSPFDKLRSVDGLAGRQSGFGKMAFDAAASALGHLMLGQRGKEARRRPSLLVGLGGEIGPDQLDGGKPQLGQEQLDAGGVDGIGRLHAAPPSSRVSEASQRGRTVPSSS